MINFKVRDFRDRGFWVSDDVYMNGYARHLGTTASMVYFCLCRHADKEQKAFPSQQLIAEELGINDRVVMRKIKLLEDWGIIKKEKTRNTAGEYLFNTYFLLDKSGWKLPPTQNVHMESTYIKSTPPPTQIMYLKDTHKKDTHTNPLIPPSDVSAQEKPERPAKRLAGKSYSKPEWLLSLGNDDIGYIQEEFPEVSAVKIREIAKECYYWQKNKGAWKKDQKMTLRNWVKNDTKWGKEKEEKKGGIAFNEYN
jgi:hypothetical protein